MLNRRLGVLLLLTGFFAPGLQAQIKHIEIRVEGMT
jgi:hypothetical protein